MDEPDRESVGLAMIRNERRPSERASKRHPHPLPRATPFLSQLFLSDQALMWNTCFVLLLGNGAALHRTHFGKHLEEKVGMCYQLILQLVQACLETGVPNLQTVDRYLQSDQQRC